MLFRSGLHTEEHNVHGSEQTFPHPEPMPVHRFPIDWQRIAAIVSFLVVLDTAVCDLLSLFVFYAVASHFEFCIASPRQKKAIDSRLTAGGHELFVIKKSRII